MPGDSLSVSEIYGRFANLSARLDALDETVFTNSGAVSASTTEPPYIGYGSTPGAFRGYPLGAFGGPEVGEVWIVPAPSMAFQMSPEFAPIGIPTLTSNGQEFGEGGRIVTLTGTLFGSPNVENLDSVIVTVPEWARPNSDQLLDDCSSLRVRWIIWPDGEPGFEVVQTDIVTGFVSAETGVVNVPEEFWPTPPPIEGFNAMLVDFMLCEWYQIQGYPPAPNSQYGVKVIVPETGMDTSEPWPYDGVEDGDLVLLANVDENPERSGIYRIVYQSGGGAGPSSTPIVYGMVQVENVLDGGHDGSHVWSSAQVRSGVLWEQATEWGIESADLVQLTGPREDDPIQRSGSEIVSEIVGSGGFANLSNNTLEASLGFEGNAFVVLQNPGYGRWREFRLNVENLTAEAITVNLSGSVSIPLEGNETGAVLVHIRGAYNDEFQQVTLLSA